jgi:(S)-ureidoglycine aminohydrolase
MNAYLLLCMALCGADAQADSVSSGVYPFAALTATTTSIGETRSILEGGTTPLSHLSLRAETVQPGASAHGGEAHGDAEELIIVREGSVRIRIGADTHVVGPGSVAVVMPDEAHSLENAGADQATWFAFQYRSRQQVDPARADQSGGSFVIDWDDVEMRETATGGRRDFFDRATSMFERFEMHVSTLNEGLTNHAAHTHRAEEFVVVMRSDVEMLIGETLQTATAGDVIFLESMIPHALNNIGTGSTEYFAFQWQ